MPTPVLAEMRAYLRYATSEDAQMPDPLGYADLRWPANLALDYGDLILPDLEHAYFANPVGSPWGSRKKDRSLRHMTTVNPAAELRVRLALNPHSKALHAAQTDHAISNRFDLKSDTKSGIEVLKHRPSGSTHARFRSMLDRQRDAGHQHGFKTDISAFYPSVRPARAAEAVARCTDSETASEIHLVLERFERETGFPGLPVGAECSSLFSNLVLAPVDDVMDKVPNIEWLRWADDFLVVDGAPQLVDAAYSHLDHALGMHDLSLSSTKTISTTVPGSTLTVAHLIDSFVGSQGDLESLKRRKNPDPESVRLAERALLNEIENPRRRTSRMNRITRFLSSVPPCMQEMSNYLANALIREPHIWEAGVPRPVAYLAHVATPVQWLDLIELACGLVSDQPVTDEQVAHIACAVARHAPTFENRAAVSERMLAVFRAAESAIVKGWALRAATLLDPTRILPLLFEARWFDHLSPLEQRWALGLAVVPDHKAFLDEQARSGRWRLTARWRLATCG